MHDNEITTVSPEESDPKSVSTLLVGGVGAALLVVIILLLEVLYQRTIAAEEYKKVIAEHPGTPWAARAEHEMKRGYGVDFRPDYHKPYVPRPGEKLIKPPKL